MALQPLSKDEDELIQMWPSFFNHAYNCWGSSGAHAIGSAIPFGQLTQHSQWLLFVGRDESPCGIVRFTPYSADHSTAVWDYFFDQNCPRSAEVTLAYESMEYAFARLKLRKLISYKLCKDEEGIFLQRMFGFKKEGTLREAYLHQNKYLDVMHFGIFENEWEQVSSQIHSRGLFLESLELAGKVQAKNYSIVILSDADSWLKPYLYELIDEWQAAGYTVAFVHTVRDAPPADFCFCLSFGKILPPEIRSQYRHTLVVHESDLPKGRGWAPMSWQILEGCDSVPVTLLEAADDVDSGVIYAQEYLDLDGTELNPEWRARQAKITKNLCRKWIDEYPEIVGDSRDQSGEPTFYPRRSYKDSELDLSRTLGEQINLLRIVDNDKYPAYFDFKDRRFILKVFYGDIKASG